VPQIPARPDLQTLLLEAIHRRDAGAARRLTGQWVHRRGVASLTTFRTTTLISLQDTEASDWLQQQLETVAPASMTPVAPASVPQAAPALDPAPAVVAPLARAWQALPALVVDEAFASLTEAFPSLSLVHDEPPVVTPAPIETIEPLREPSFEPVIEAPSAPAVTPMAVSLSPIQGGAAAPAPSTLADLRAWLSGGDQHRRAS